MFYFIYLVTDLFSVELCVCVFFYVFDIILINKQSTTQNNLSPTAI